MTRVVVDASTALAWCFPDETSADADNVLVSLEGKTELVPAVWGLEIANAVLAGERKKRLTQPEIRRFTVLLESLSLVQDVQPVGEHIDKVLPLARKYNLSAYDAAYLELSIRTGAPLATLDEKLGKAASHAGVKRFVVETD
ncbi:MAG: type II toxin-antitoxin system VapC family toxin [Acidobacteriota bacterium]|nr:type II toxin-antitoxin system VapC family toxin [Acidobacteriota bacterium]